MTEPLGRRSQTGLGLKQKCTRRNKQTHLQNPESHRVMLSWPCTPWGQVCPLKNEQVWINVAEILVLGTEVDNQIHLSW